MMYSNKYGRVDYSGKRVEGDVPCTGSFQNQIQNVMGDLV